MSRFRLPLVPGLFFCGEFVRHDGGDHPPVGDEDGGDILRFQPGESLQHPPGHGLAALPTGGHVAQVVPGDPGDVFRVVLQLLIGVQLEFPKVDLLELRAALMGHVAKEQRQGLLRPHHAAGEKPRRRQAVAQLL